MSGPLASLDALVGVAGPHPVLLHDVGDTFAGAYAASDGSAWLLARRHTRTWLTVAGDPSAAAALLRTPAVRGWVLGLDAVSVWLPQGRTDLVAGLLELGDGNDWDWLWTGTAPPVLARETDLVALDETHRRELDALLTAHNPRTHGRPFAHPDQLWVGVRDASGELVACGCSEPGWTATPFLAGITVHPGQRGRGLGAAVTAYLTREAVERTGACALGMYADNDLARDLYHHLGYETAARWSTREVLPAPG